MPAKTAEPDLGSLRIDAGSRAGGKTGKRLGLFAACLGGIVLLGGLAAYVVNGQKTVVEVATAQAAGDPRTGAVLNASGYVTPLRRATIAAKITGRTTAVYAEEGMRATAGQLLATLDDSDARKALESAKADRESAAAQIADLEVQLRLADIQLQRTQELRAANVQSQEALDTAQATADSLRAKIALAKKQVAAAEARIGEAQQAVDNCTIRAPFSGMIVSKDAQVGEMVSPISAGGGFTRTGIATIVDMKSLIAEVDVNESYIARVKIGQKVISILDAYPDWQIPSKVYTIIPTADREKATVKVRISFDKLDPRILPDMGVKVAFLEEESGGAKGKAGGAKALIPRAAVRKEKGGPIVFLVRDGKLERRAISLAGDRGSDVEVLAGITPGDTLVVRGPEELRDGQAVEIKQ
jgi:RND family efflux transporter MFP subunit